MNERVDFKDVVRIALWFGLATGLVEGAAYLTLQNLRLLNWQQQTFPVAGQIIWASPLVDALVFCTAGLSSAWSCDPSRASGRIL